MIDFKQIFGMERQEFFTVYWRKKPLFFHPETSIPSRVEIHEDRFESIAQRLREVKPSYVQSGGNGVTFLQNVDLVSDCFEVLSGELEQICGLKNRANRNLTNTWFDSVRTRAGSSGGIGSHFDHSDNFIFQASGEKTWRLHSPEVIPEEVIRKRLNGDPGVGSFAMPEKAVKYSLKPGDALYVPLCWLHEGKSDSDSLSISWVCNIDTPLTTLLPLLMQFLAQSHIWCDALESNLDAPSIDKSFMEIIGVLDDPVLRKDLCTAWRKMLIKNDG